MKILLLGANGQVGRELRRALLPLGQVIACDRQTANLENPESVGRLVEEVKPDVVVNAAAYTAVDKAESEADIAELINSTAVEVLARKCAQIGAWLVHYSTDYVFDGQKIGAYSESDATCPLSIYGKTKLQGEQAIFKSGCRHLIFRTSWVYAAHGSNFAKTMLRLAKDRDTLSVVGDQFGVPTSASLIADVSVLCLHSIKSDGIVSSAKASGIFNLTPTGKTSWHGYAQFLIEESTKLGEEFSIKAESITAITTAEYPTAAARPGNSLLSTKKISQTFNIELPGWQDHVLLLISDLASENKK